MTAATTALQAPDLSRTAALAGKAAAAHARPGAARALIGRALAAGADLIGLGDTPADRLFPTGLTLARAGLPGEQVAALLAGMATGLAGEASVADLGRGLAAAEVVLAHPAMTVGPGAVAVPTTAVLGAAACACVVAGRLDQLATVLDLAASLMVLTPPAAYADEPTGAAAELWAGHAALAGWLAATLPDAGFTELPGSVAHTMSAAIGAGEDDASPDETTALWEFLSARP